LEFDVSGIIYVKFKADQRTVKAVKTSIQEAVSQVVGQSHKEFAQISVKHVIVNYTWVPQKPHMLKVRVRITPPRSDQAMLLWSKMISSSAAVRSTIEHKMSFAEGISLVASGPISIKGGIIAFTETKWQGWGSFEDEPATSTTTSRKIKSIGVINDTQRARLSAFLVGAMWAMIALSL